MDYKKELEHFGKQLNFFDEAINKLSPRETEWTELVSVIGPMLKFNHDTGLSIKLLAENDLLRDLIILSRPFVENIINVGFICAKGEEAIIKSKKYAYQKGYRDLFRELKVGEIEIKVGLNQHKDIIDNSRPQQLIEALEEYTTARGKEKSSWTEETAKEKVEIVSNKYGIMVNGFLTFAFFNIYRDVSEIIHGSYYGVRIMTGLQSKDMTSFKSADEAGKYFTEHQFQLATLILQQVSVSIVSVLEILSQEFKSSKSIKEIRDKSYDALNEHAANATKKKGNK